MCKILKHCPFCGKTEHLIITTETEAFTGDDEVNDTDYVGVVCDFGTGGCGASGGFRKTEEEAIDAWNKRCEIVKCKNCVFGEEKVHEED